MALFEPLLKNKQRRVRPQLVWQIGSKVQEEANALDSNDVQRLVLLVDCGGQADAVDLGQAERLLPMPAMPLKTVTTSSCAEIEFRPQSM